MYGDELTHNLTVLSSFHQNINEFTVFRHEILVSCTKSVYQDYLI